MKRIARVASVEAGKITVIAERSSSCGSCRACSGAKSGTVALPVQCNFEVQCGDRVEILSSGGPSAVILQLIKLFLLPLIGFWVGFGMLLSHLGEGAAAVCGVAGFGVVFLLIRWTEKRKDSVGRCLYRVVRKIPDS